MALSDYNTAEKVGIFLRNLGGGDTTDYINRKNKSIIATQDEEEKDRKRRLEKAKHQHDQVNARIKEIEAKESKVTPNSDRAKRLKAELVKLRTTKVEIQRRLDDAYGGVVTPTVAPDSGVVSPIIAPEPEDSRTKGLGGIIAKAPNGMDYDIVGKKYVGAGENVNFGMDGQQSGMGRQPVGFVEQVNQARGMTPGWQDRIVPQTPVGNVNNLYGNGGLSGATTYGVEEEELPTPRPIGALDPEAPNLTTGMVAEDFATITMPSGARTSVDRKNLTPEIIAQYESKGITVDVPTEQPQDQLATVTLPSGVTTSVDAKTLTPEMIAQYQNVGITVDMPQQATAQASKQEESIDDILSDLAFAPDLVTDLDTVTLVDPKNPNNIKVLNKKNSAHHKEIIQLRQGGWTERKDAEKKPNVQSATFQNKNNPSDTLQGHFDPQYGHYYHYVDGNKQLVDTSKYKVTTTLSPVEDTSQKIDRLAVLIRKPNLTDQEQIEKNQLNKELNNLDISNRVYTSVKEVDGKKQGVFFLINQTDGTAMPVVGEDGRPKIDIRVEQREQRLDMARTEVQRRALTNIDNLYKEFGVKNLPFITQYEALLAMEEADVATEQSVKDKVLAMAFIRRIKPVGATGTKEDIESISDMQGVPEGIKQWAISLLTGVQINDRIRKGMRQYLDNQYDVLKNREKSVIHNGKIRAKALNKNYKWTPPIYHMTEQGIEFMADDDFTLMSDDDLNALIKGAVPQTKDKEE